MTDTPIEDIGRPEENTDEEGGWSFDPSSGKFYDNNGDILEFEFFPRKRTFITSGGVPLRFKPLNSQYVFAYQAKLRREMQPDIPKRPIEYDEGKYYLESNTEDPSYQRDLALYNQMFGLKLLQYTFHMSIKEDIPPEEEWSDDFKKAIETHEATGPAEKKYLYVLSLINSEIEMTAFTLVVQGQTLPTYKGVRIAEERFPSEAEQPNGHMEL